VRNHIGGAWVELKKKLQEAWQPMKPLPPSGCILVSGLVELEGPKACVVLDVAAWWDPKTRTYDRKSMWLGLRRVSPKVQVPARR